MDYIKYTIFAVNIFFATLLLGLIQLLDTISLVDSRFIHSVAVHLVLMHIGLSLYFYLKKILRNLSNIKYIMAVVFIVINIVTIVPNDFYEYLLTIVAKNYVYVIPEEERSEQMQKIYSIYYDLYYGNNARNMFGIVVLFSNTFYVLLMGAILKSIKIIINRLARNRIRTYDKIIRVFTIIEPYLIIVPVLFFINSI